MNRCLNNIFSYCTGTPKHITKKVSIQYRDFGGLLQTTDQLETRCKLDFQSCGSYLSQADLHATIPT